uniref:Uncharacterized protein n=1 Tax=Hippocampus comes TaxID=109280 RepID=A0A3Q2XTF6_HIPCM
MPSRGALSQRFFSFFYCDLHQGDAQMIRGHQDPPLSCSIGATSTVALRFSIKAVETLVSCIDQMPSPISWNSNFLISMHRLMGHTLSLINPDKCRRTRWMMMWGLASSTLEIYACRTICQNSLPGLSFKMRSCKNRRK